MITPAISVQLYSVRTALEADPAGTIDRLADAGFTHVEAGLKFLKALPDLLPAIQGRGLATPTLTASLVGVNRSEAWQTARAIGAHTVVDTFVPAERWTDLAAVEWIAAELNAAAAEAAEHGLAVGYHNHWWELETRVDGQTALDALVGRLDDGVALEVDAYWVAVGGEDPVDFLTRHADRVRFLHLKDGPITRDNHAQQPAGSGSMPIGALLAAVPRLETAVVEFDDYAGDVFAAVAQSRVHLAEQLGGRA